ncbi:protein arginine methyltransferase NDUFAF7, mitochondrial isoform X1 [Fukomys damarensis]|uniref:protein arginine methyltransferase NDUFAF7, mitochondrial isoform X1 n=1 Tax=Fukomys damarensis TaxID=885580 RepID=UPI00053F9ECE|nr:protein arginine methyltransferase NDUFAF7, mitochondrial isoform X1 [Fukomys damarensis]
MGVLVRSAARQLCCAARAVIPCTWRGKYFSSGNDEPPENNRVTPMLRHLMYKIKSTGPITVAEYMKEVLTNPAKGYYVHRDMLGEKGDFITSPEISQIFGEVTSYLLGIWFISEWMAAGKNAAFQLVELGPGRGTLMGDILRVFSQLGSVLKNCDVSVHLVEVSQALSELQALTLTEAKIPVEQNAESLVYMKGVTKSGFPISWYRDLQDVPKGCSFFLAHEFFDVLPVHKFQKTPQGWREVLIDIDPQVSDKLRFILAPCVTPAEALLQHDETRDHVEVCPDAGVIIQELCERIALTGGAALIADYGHDGTKTDTFRGFYGHKLHDVLIAPGTADLTADVDFSYLRRMVQGKVASLGPIEQQTFLKNMGIDVRLKVLFDKSDEPSVRQQLLQGYDMLMHPQKMGERFNFFALLPHQRLQGRSHHINTCQSQPSASPVAGFSELAWQ